LRKCPEAYVVLKSAGGELTLEGELRHHVRQRLGGNKTPRAFYFVPTLPDTPARSAQQARVEAVTLAGGAAESEATQI
jgi:acyl-coenzyme A synthetase/AMP-(fatty) acid ligase